MSKDIIVVIGKARAGKSTFSRLISAILGVEYNGTSKVVYEAMALARGCSVEDLYSLPKEELRPHLIKFADYLCDMKADILSEATIKRGFSIVDGVRRLQELDALKKNPDFDIFTIYIDRKHGALEDNFNIPASEADLVVYNDASLACFEETSVFFGKKIKKDKQFKFK